MLGHSKGSNLTKTLTMLSWILALLALIYILRSLVISGFLPDHLQSAFGMIGISNPGGGRAWPSFADLRWVTALSECGVELDKIVNQTSVGCDPYGRTGGLGYPPVSVFFARALAVKGQHTGLLGFGMGLAVITTLILMARRLVRPGWLANTLITLMLLGFPVQLALERANIDLVVFVLLCSLAALSCLAGSWALLSAAGVTWLAVAIKMYPLVGIAAWWLDSLRAWRRKPLLPMAILAGLMAGLCSVWDWYQHSSKVAAQTTDRDIGHGLGVRLITEQMTLLRSWPYANTGPLQNPGQPLLAIGLVILAFALFRQQGLHKAWRTLLNERTQGFERQCLSAMTNVLGLAWLGCYLFSGSIDYRMILMLPALIACWAVLGQQGTLSPWSRAFLGLIMIGVVYGWFAPFFPLPSLIRQLNLLSDLFSMPLLAGSLLALLLSPLPFPFGDPSKPSGE